MVCKGGEGGVWPDNETLGLPKGMNLKPMSLAELIGLAPGTSCDFGVCVPLGMGVVTVATPDSGGNSLYTIHVVVVGSIVAGSIALHASEIDNEINILHPGMLNFRDDNFLCSMHLLVNPSTGKPEFHKDLVNPFPTEKVLPTFFSVADHARFDIFPDLTYRATGRYLDVPGRSRCE